MVIPGCITPNLRLAFRCLLKGCSDALQNSFFGHADKLGLGLLSSLPALELLSSLPALKGTRSKSRARNPYYEDFRHTQPAPLPRPMKRDATAEERSD